MENEKLVEEFNDLAQRYNYLLSENEKKDKELNYTLKLFNQVLKSLKYDERRALSYANKSY